MTLSQQLITIALCSLATVLTRFAPFVIFSSKKPVPNWVNYLGRALPGAVFAMLVVYCLKNVQITEYAFLSNPDRLFKWFGLPELIALASTIALHLWKRKTLLSIAAGTIVYMLLVNFVFVA